MLTEVRFKLRISGISRFTPQDGLLSIFSFELFSFLFQLPSLHEDDRWQIPAQLRMKIWLGQEKEEQEWTKMQTEGELSVVAETVSFLYRVVLIFYMYPTIKPLEPQKKIN